MDKVYCKVGSETTLQVKLPSRVQLQLLRTPRAQEGKRRKDDDEEEEEEGKRREEEEEEGG